MSRRCLTDRCGEGRLLGVEADFHGVDASGLGRDGFFHGEWQVHDQNALAFLIAQILYGVVSRP